MIARLQKLKLLRESLTEQLQRGRAPHLADTLSRVSERLRGRQLATPLTQLRPAVPGLPIGGEDGRDIERTFTELTADMELLYTAQLEVTSRAIDSYDIFATRRDRLAQRLNDLILTARTLLAQVAAGSRSAVLDSFHTLDLIDPGQSTIEVDLEEGICLLPPDTSRSVAFDGSRVKVVRTDKSAGVVEPGPPFAAVFSPYRLESWYANLPIGGRVRLVVNVTGADFEQGASEEVTLNALRLSPTGPLQVAIEWSPDSFNFQPLSPAIDRLITGRTTFHFNPVTVGFLRFTISHPPVPGEHAIRQQQVGVQRIELLARGFTSSAQLYSRAFRFDEPVHTVVCELDAQVPFGTRIVPYVAQSPTGPWLPVTAQPLLFDSRVWIESALTPLTEEDETNPATFWEGTINAAAQPLPGEGELTVGRDQVRLEAFTFDWRQQGEASHVPEATDWQPAPAAIRAGVFVPVGQINAGGDLAAVAASGFTEAANPIAVDVQDDSYLVVALIEDGGTRVLQPGFNYRLSAAVWCPVPTTLDGQKIGVVNPSAYSGVGGTAVAPLSLWVNGEKRFQKSECVTHVNELSGTAYQTTLPLLQGWNQLELLLTVPSTLTPGSGGVATQAVYVYFQPNLFGPNLEQNLGIRYVQAYSQPWPRLSEFALRYNTPPGNRAAWAWKTQVETGIVQAALFNHDPRNSRYRGTDVHPSFTTVDGVNASYPLTLLLRYPAERPAGESAPGGLLQDPRALYFRADFFQEDGATQPPVLSSYRLIVN